MSDSEKPIVKINHFIRITEADVEKFSDVFKMGEKRADDYCPTPEECENILVQNLQKYLPFMLWIEETGYDTPENTENRKYLRRLLYSKMIVKS